jgi:SAM-dependent methyltransferase
MGNGNTTFEPKATALGAASFVPTADAAEDPGTTRARRIWTAGAYDRVAAGFRHEAADFVARRALVRGERILDAACGSGNLTIPAAHTGAHVTGIDIAPNLLEIASDWAQRESLDIRLDEGSVETLPYADASFDRVISMFGVMFAARPALVVSELARVTKPGGTVALANWTRTGFIGTMLATHVAYVPPPAGAVSPLLWGDEATLSDRFSPTEWSLSFTRRVLRFRYPHTPAGTAELFRATYGPTVRTFEALDEDGRVRFAAALRELWGGNAIPGTEGTQVDSEYLEVVATRR